MLSYTKNRRNWSVSIDDRKILISLAPNTIFVGFLLLLFYFLVFFVKQAPQDAMSFACLRQTLCF